MTEVEVVTPIDMEFEDVPVKTPRLHLSTGEPGTGKTALLFSIGELIREENGKDIYVVMKPYDRKLKHMAPDLPKHVKELRDLTRLGEESDNPLQDVILIGDDWKRVTHARRAMSNMNVVIDNLFGIIRHDDMDILIDDQTASSIDRNNIIRKNYMWIKPPFEDEIEFGRSQILSRLEMAYNLNMEINEVLLFNSKIHKGPILVRNIPLVPYWTEELSRMHRRQPRGFMKRLKSNLL